MSYHLRKYKQSRYWYARVTYPDGSRGNWESTRKENKRDAKRVAEDRDRAATSNHPPLSLEDAYAELAKHMRRKKDTDSTMEVLSLKASHVTSFFGPKRDAHSLELKDTEAYWDHRRDHTRTLKNGRTVHGSADDPTVSKELGYLMSALRRCKKIGLYHGDHEKLWPEALAKTFKGRKRWLPWTEYLAVLDTITPQWRDHLIVYVSTGVRFAELYVLHARDIRGDFLHVEGSKTELAKRDIPLSLEAKEALQRRVAASPDGLLFPMTSPDMKAQKRAWLRALDKACRRAKIVHASTNDLRRTFASWCWQRGVDERVCVRWMGHGSSKMVREVYAQPSEEQHMREMAKMPTRHLPPLAETPQPPIPPAPPPQLLN